MDDKKHDTKVPDQNQDGLGGPDDKTVVGKPETFPKEVFAADPNKLPPFPEQGGDVPRRLDSTDPPMFLSYDPPAEKPAKK